MDGSNKKVVELKAHGDVAEEDPARRGGPGTDDADDNEKAPRRSRRVASLDVFRGLTVAVSASLMDHGSQIIRSSRNKVSEVVHNCKPGIERWGCRCLDFVSLSPWLLLYSLLIGLIN